MFTTSHGYMPIDESKVADKRAPLIEDGWNIIPCGWLVLSYAIRGLENCRQKKFGQTMHFSSPCIHGYKLNH